MKETHPEALDAHNGRRVEQHRRPGAVFPDLLADSTQDLGGGRYVGVECERNVEHVLRAQSFDRLVTCRTSPFGMMTSSPFSVRSLVVRSVSASTVPEMPTVAPGGAIRTTSP